MPIFFSHKTSSTPPDTPTSSLVHGRRLVADIVGLLQQNSQAVMEHSQSCAFCGTLEFVRETRIGLSSCLEYRCSKRPLCPLTYVINMAGNEPSDVNQDFVRGSLAVGIGFSQAEELCASLNMPFMSQKLFRNCEVRLGEEIWETLLYSMKEAAEEEIELARQRREQPDEEGFWRIPVVVDGGWSKRSYGHNYNANSGVGVIVGRYSRRILYIGVHNKFCMTCRHAAKRNVEPVPHTCACNWNSTSTAMEKSIIVQGFNESEMLYGLRYTILIGEGDSSVYQSVLTGVSYGYIIKKVECANHAVKCYTNKLFAAAKNT